MKLFESYPFYCWKPLIWSLSPIFSLKNVILKEQQQKNVCSFETEFLIPVTTFETLLSRLRVSITVPFYHWEVFHGMRGPQFVYLLTSWRTLGFPNFEIINRALRKTHVQAFVWRQVFTKSLITQEQYCSKGMLNFIRNCILSLKKLHHTEFLPAIYESSNCSKSSSAAGMVRFTLFFHLDKCLVESQHHLN